MFYDEAKTIIINKKESEFRNDAVIFAEQIAGDDALNAVLLRFHCSKDSYFLEIAFNDLNEELSRIETHYATNDIEEEVGILLTENDGKRDENGEWL